MTVSSGLVGRGIAPLLSTAALLVLLTALPVLSAETGYVVGLSTYPVRANPQFADEATSRLAVGQKLQILEKVPGWHRIRAGDTTGWMPESVIGKTAPPVVQLAPMSARVKEIEKSLNRLVKENSTLKDENEKLVEKTGGLETDLQKIRSRAKNAKSYQRLWGVALGGGLVIFGWITGFALAAVSRRRSGHKKYRID